MTTSYDGSIGRNTLGPRRRRTPSTAPAATGPGEAMRTAARTRVYRVMSCLGSGGEKMLTGGPTTCQDEFRPCNSTLPIPIIPDNTTETTAPFRSPHSRTRPVIPTLAPVIPALAPVIPALTPSFPHLLTSYPALAPVIPAPVSVIPAPVSVIPTVHVISRTCLRHSRTYPRHSREGGNLPASYLTEQNSRTTMGL